MRGMWLVTVLGAVVLAGVGCVQVAPGELGVFGAGDQVVDALDTSQAAYARSETRVLELEATLADREFADELARHTGADGRLAFKPEELRKLFDRYTAGAIDRAGRAAALADSGRVSRATARAYIRAAAGAKAKLEAMAQAIGRERMVGAAATAFGLGRWGDLAD